MGFIGLPRIGSFVFLVNVGLMHSFPTTATELRHVKDFLPLIAEQVLTKLFGEEIEVRTPSPEHLI
jgi:hypothetical protein